MTSIESKKLTDMPHESPCIKVPKQEGQKTLALANKLNLTAKNLLIQKDEDALCIPLTRQPDEKELETFRAQVPELQSTAGVFAEKRSQEKTLEEVLESQLPPHLLAALPKALDVVGDIAIIDVPPELETYKKTLGAAILQTHKSICTVLAKAGAVSGTYRIRDLEFLAGEQKTQTIHKEYGCSYYVDVAKAYFSPRLSTEHMRVASLVREGEVVVDLFAGVGPFAVLIAKNQPEARVYAIDLNADAVELLKRNIRLNRVENRVYPIVGDARAVVDENLAGVADRVIMNLPESAGEFIDAACKAAKPTGGTVHFYGFVRMPDTMEDLKQRFSAAVQQAGRTVQAFTYTKTVRATAPYEWQVVLDAEIR
jgi:tRNA (guanine37-N1)-methyltransferase